VDPKYDTKIEDLRRRLLEQPGTLDRQIRRAAADGGDIPQEVAGFVEKVRRHAYTVTDDDVDGLRRAGYSEDQVFELTVAAAYGAARLRLEKGLDAMTESPVLAAGPQERTAR